MSNGIQYDEAWANRIVAIYSTPDVVAQRRAVLQLLDLKPGEQVVDIGSGPGMLVYEMAGQVGSNGRVVGVDISESMNMLATARCADLPWVEFHQHDATQLPFSDGEFDVAVSTQVYEYVEDVEMALTELNRILKPGGRAVILDTDWDSIVWNTTDRPRLNRILELFDQHCAHPYLARHLLPWFRDTGFAVQDCHVHTLLNLSCEPNTYSYGLIDFIGSYVSGTGKVSEAEVAAWADELHRLSEIGAYFFSLNRYIFVVTK